MAVLEKKYVKNKIALLNAGLQIAGDREARREEIVTHIKSVEHDPQFRLNPEFPPGLTWFNSGPLSFEEHLKGKVVVLDFFTYCCINCMHVLPDLAQLEQTHSVEEGLVVIGVHSAKFLNEKLPENIKNAIGRYGISHPVVNDGDITLWNRLGVVCWPTLVIIGPDQQLLHYIIGEGHGEELKVFVDTAMQYYHDSGRLNKSPLPSVLPVDVGLSSNVLKYPGKICCDAEGKMLFIADSSHNRILAVDRETGKVHTVYGNGKAGLKNGAANEAEFHSPQGLVWNRDCLFVADTENHSIRKIDLSSGTVVTVAGTGRQGKDKEGGGRGEEQEISSPWDLALGGSPGSSQLDVLYIAMAGTHQIWVQFLDNCKWIKGSEYSKGTTLRFSGSGEEANRNNSYPHKAAFAQPSGLALAAGSTLYVADSESSTVRSVSVKDGSVKAVVGGAIDPLDLFAFGDADGKAREVRLQHPLGVVWSEGEGVLYVADSYNHKIKVVDLATKRCTTLAGMGESGLVDGAFEHAQFSEPGGLCVDPTGKTLFVADTNNHAIRVLDLDKKTVTQLSLHLPEVSPTPFKRLTGKKAQQVNLEPVAVRPGGDVRITLSVGLPPGCHWTEGAPSAWQVIPEPSMYSVCDPGRGNVEENKDVTVSLSTVPQPDKNYTAQVELMLYFCEASGLCHMQGAVLNIPLKCSETAANPASTEVQYSPEVPKTLRLV